MTEPTQKRIKELIPTDVESETIAWDKGEPKYLVVCEAKTFHVRNLNTWCEFYDVNYQMLLRTLRESDGTYKGVQVTKL